MERKGITRGRRSLIPASLKYLSAQSIPGTVPGTEKIYLLEATGAYDYMRGQARERERD